jgi:hypothetical protein
MDVPIVVVTHRVPQEGANREGSPFTFVTDGIPKAIDVAREIAGDKDVVVGARVSPSNACNLGFSMRFTSTLCPWCWDVGSGSSIT